MSVQSEKFKLIEWLVHLQDTSILDRINKLREQSEQKAYEASLKPMTREKLIARALKSEEDIKAGRVHTIDDVMKEDWD